jgi:hypothetical protein
MKKNKRKDVSLGQKFQYPFLAINEMDISKGVVKYKTDVVGIACQFSSQPKLKREDFNGIMDLTLNEIVNILEIEL